MEINKQEELLNLLLKEKILTESGIAEIKKEAQILNESAEQIILEKKIVDYEIFAKYKAKIYGLLYENLVEKEMSDNILSLIPLEVARNYKIICFDKIDNKIKVGLTDPENYKAIEAVNFLAKEGNLDAEYYLISEISFNIAIRQYKTLKKEVTTALKTKEEEEAIETGKTKKDKESNLEEITKTAPVAKIVSVIIRHAIDGGASDIHIEPQANESRVRYRIDGILGTSLILPKNVHSAIIGRIKVMANLKLDETRIPQDGRIRVKIGDKDVDLRISILPLLGDEKVVMRILDVSKKAPTIEDLGFMGNSLKIIKNNTKRTEGMFLITGPTGSGKSTTLFSILNILNKEGINISTLEDPVEYYIAGVNQSQVKPEIGFTFASGLRALLRQDPNVIMVGEIRDNETAELAVHAGLTGHFVLTTLHTNDAIGAIPRLVDMGAEPFLLGSTLNTVVAQRLVRKICSFCKAEEKIPEERVKDVNEQVEKIPAGYLKDNLPDFNIKNLIFYKGKGCSHCGNTGYAGRLVIAEVIDITEDIKEIIIENKKSLKTEDLVKSQNFITIKQDSLIKVLLGLTTMEEVMRVLSE